MAADRVILATEYDAVDFSSGYSFAAMGTDVDIALFADEIDLAPDGGGAGPDPGGGGERPTSGMLYPRREC